jgi:disulfide bond formation protein DsbB
MQNKKNLRYIFFFSISVLIVAYFIEFILGYKPCNLCLIERIPYWGAIILISIIVIFNKYEKLFLSIILILFIIGVIISIYHFGIEQGIFSESLVCEIGKSNSDLSTDDLLNQLQNQQISCKDVKFRIFGFSLASINTLISLIISVIVAKILINYEKNK